LAIEATKVLVLSGEEKHIETVFNYVNNGDFRKAKTGEPVWLVNGAVSSLAELTPVEAKQYLGKLAITYPYDPKKDDPQKGYDYGPPDFGVAKVIQDRLREIEDSMAGRAVKIDKRVSAR